MKDFNKMKNWEEYQKRFAETKSVLEFNEVVGDLIKDLEESCCKISCCKCRLDWLDKEVEHHIDLDDRYALLDDGSIVTLWDGTIETTNLRKAYRDTDREYYYDKYAINEAGIISQTRIHSKIIGTGNTMSEILELIRKTKYWG